jgi:hypothetical protein
MRPPLRCSFPNCPDERENLYNGEYCLQHTCDSCYKLAVGGCEYCLDHKCTWRGPGRCNNRKDKDDLYCTHHAGVDWDCKWSISTCESPRIIDSDTESEYCSQHKCTIPSCDKRRKTGGKFCAEDHSCLQPGCTNESLEDGCCEECVCDWGPSGACSNPKAEGLYTCNHHVCPQCGRSKGSSDEVCGFCRCSYPGCAEVQGFVPCWKHECQHEDCERIMDARVQETVFCKVHRCRKKQCPRNTWNSMYCEEHACISNNCIRKRFQNKFLCLGHLSEYERYDRDVDSSDESDMSEATSF